MEGKKQTYQRKSSKSGQREEEKQQVKKYVPKKKLKNQSDEDGFTGGPDDWFDGIFTFP
jgi:hypothetical protein